VCTYHVLFFSISNQFDIENDTPVGITDSSSVLEVNMPSTNEPNVWVENTV